MNEVLDLFPDKFRRNVELYCIGNISVGKSVQFDFHHTWLNVPDREFTFKESRAIITYCGYILQQKRIVNIDFLYQASLFDFYKVSNKILGNLKGDLSPHNSYENVCDCLKMIASKMDFEEFCNYCYLIDSAYKLSKLKDVNLTTEQKIKIACGILYAHAIDQNSIFSKLFPETTRQITFLN
jgi:hypothetical protein